MPILFPIQHDYDALLKLNMPENLLYKNRVERLVLGVFSESSTERNMGTSSRLKIPFSVQPGELFSFANPDTIMGGWGAWAGGIFILFMFGFVYMICKNNYSIETKLSLLCFFAFLLFYFRVCRLQFRIILDLRHKFGYCLFLVWLRFCNMGRKL